MVCRCVPTSRYLRIRVNALRPLRVPPHDQARPGCAVAHGGVVVALAEMEPAVAGAESLAAVASSVDESPADRVVLGVVAVLAVVLVPGYAERLMDTPLSWGQLVSMRRWASARGELRPDPRR